MVLSKSMYADCGSKQKVCDNVGALKYTPYQLLTESFEMAQNLGECQLRIYLLKYLRNIVILIIIIIIKYIYRSVLTSKAIQRRCKLKSFIPKDKDNITDLEKKF